MKVVKIFQAIRTTKIANALSAVGQIRYCRTDERQSTIQDHLVKIERKFSVPDRSLFCDIKFTDLKV